MGRKLGQHFLISNKYKTFVVEQIQEIKKDFDVHTVLEIGPGKGALTEFLFQIFGEIFVFEKDLSFKNILIKILKDENKLLFGDVLELDIGLFIKENNISTHNTLIVGNLPYYITSPILTKFFWDTDCFVQGIFLIQKEVAEKIQSSANKKSYLWYLLNYNYEIHYLETVPAQAFYPPPKVESAFILLKKKLEPEKVSKENLILFLNNVSPYKRKTLGKISKILESYKDKQQILSWKFIIPDHLRSKRLEELTWDDIYGILD